METVGQRITKARLRKNLNQKELCQLTGISESTLSRFEKGIREPRSSSLMTLSEHLDVSIEYLMGLTDIMESNIIMEKDEAMREISTLFENAENLSERDDLLLYGQPVDKEEYDKFMELMKVGISMIKIK